MAASLNKLLSSYSVLSVLGAKPRSRVLPLLVDCLACRGRLSLLVQADPAFGGEWGWCRRCNTAGDMIELAAAVWKLDVPATFAKLRHTGVTTVTPAQNELAAYTENYITRRARVTKFYVDCQRAFGASASTDLRTLQRHFGFDRAGGHDPDMRLPVGAATPESIASLGFTGSLTIGRTMSLGKHAALLVVPFYDVPGRICGLLCVSDNDDSEPAFLSTAPGESGKEGGIGMLPTALARAANESVLALTDPRLAILLQLRQAKELGRPLPIILIRSGPKFPTDKAWDNLPMADVIFWSPGDTIGAIRQARPFDARVAPREITPNEREHNLRRFAPTAWLDEVRKTAEPWHAVLRQQLRDKPPAELESLLLSLDLSEQELSRFASGCDLSLRAQLTGHIARDAPRTVQYGGVTIQEKDGKWTTGNELISEAIIRFDSVVVSTDKQSYYRGRMLFRDHSVAFTEKTATLEQGLLTWAAKHLRDTERIGIMQFHPKWDKRACGVALAFQEPVMASAVERVGWNAEHGCYVFPHFSIGREGHVRDDGAFQATMRTLPGAELKKPEPLHAGQLDLLSTRTDETRVFWAAMAAITANITAARCHAPKRGVLVVNETSKRIGVQTALAIGCQSLGRGLMTRLITYNKCGHCWPLVTADGLGYRRYDEWITLPDMANVVMALPSLAAWTVGMRRNWVIVDAPIIMNDSYAPPLAANILPNYLQDTMTRPLLPRHDDHCLATLLDMAGWFERAGGNPRVIKEAQVFLGTPATRLPVDFFTRLVLRFYRKRQLLFARTTDPVSDDAAIVYDPEKETVWIEHKAFASTILRMAKISPDIPTITESLRAAGGFIEEGERGSRLGWVLKHDWWQQRIKEVERCPTLI